MRRFILASLLAYAFGGIVGASASAQLLTTHGGLGLLGGGGGGGFSLVAHKSAGSPDGNNVTSPSINTSGADLLVVAVNYYDGNGGTYTLSDSASNTWGSPAVSHSYTAGAHGIQEVYFIHSPTTSATHTFTVTASGGLIFPSIAVQAWSGSVSSPGDQTNGAGDGTVTLTSFQPGSITPVQNNELIAVFLLNSAPQSATPTINSGFNVADYTDNDGLGHNFGMASAYLLQGTAAAVNPTWTWPTAAAIVSDIISFK